MEIHVINFEPNEMYLIKALNNVKCHSCARHMGRGYHIFIRVQGAKEHHYCIDCGKTRLEIRGSDFPSENSLLDKYKARVVGFDLDENLLFFESIVNNEMDWIEDSVKCNPGLVNERWVVTGDTPVITAVRHGRHEMVVFFTEKGSYLDEKDGEGYTALHISLNTGNQQAAEYLLSEMGYPDIPDREGKTPLLTALEKGFYKTAALLLEKGADPDFADAEGITPGQIVHQLEARGIFKFDYRRPGQSGI